MTKKYFQSGFVPPIIIILLAIIGISGILITKNISTDKSQSVANRAFNITKTKSTPTPTVSQTKSKSQTPTPTQKATPTPTTSPNTNNNSNNPTNTPVPTSTPTSTASPTPTVINYGTVKGTVKLIQSNGVPLPLAGVSVNLTCDNCNKLYNGNVHATETDNNGNFTFNNVPPSVDIQLIALAYARSTTPININLAPGETITKDIPVTLPSN